MPFDPLHPFHPPSKPCLCMCVQSCPTLCNPMDCSLPGSSVHGIFQANYWGELPFPTLGDLPTPRVKPASPGSPALAGRLFITEPPGKPTSGQPPICVCELPRPLVSTWDVLSVSLLPQHGPLCCSFSPANTFHPQSLCPWRFLCLELCHPEGHKTCFPLYFLQIFLQMPPNQWGHPGLFSYSVLFFSVTLSPPTLGNLFA